MKNNMENQNFKSINKKIFFILAGVVLLVIIDVFCISVTKNLNSQSNAVVPKKATVNFNLPTAMPTIIKKIKGSFTLKSSDGKTTAAIGQNITLNVEADSLGVNVVGYDILLDKGNMELVSVNSLLPTFSIYPNDKGNDLVITGIKRSQLETSSIWQSDKILQVVLRGKSSGEVTVKILPMLDKRSTKITDKATKVYYPEGSELKLAIQ
jgi:hypothetical protein